MNNDRRPIDRALAKEQLARISAVLKAPHLLIGGLAVQQYYPARISQDIDLVCEFETAQYLLQILYPSRDWKIVDKQGDEYRPSFQITHKVDDLGTVIFGPKITEREPYKHVDWTRLMKGAAPFNGLSGFLENILVPSPHALAYTKFISFLGRRAPEAKIRSDLTDVVDLSNCEEFSVSLFFDFLRMSKAFDTLSSDFREKVKPYQELLADSCLCGLAAVFLSEMSLASLSLEHERVSVTSKIEPLATPPERQIVSVSTAEEFLNAIGPNRVIEISSAKIDLSMASDRYMEFVRWDPEYDGRTITIRNVVDLEIRGKGVAITRLIVTPKYSYVLAFDGCRGITLRNLTLGHEPEGYCTGGVLTFSNSHETLVETCALFGCGTEGLTLHAVEGFTMKNSEIFDCAYGIMTIESSRRVMFSDSAFRNNRELYGVQIRDSEAIEFIDCRFLANIASGGLFEIVSSSDVRLVRGAVTDNRCDTLGAIEIDGTDIQRTFEKSRNS